MITKIIDGRKIAKEITESLKTKVEDFIQKNRITPELAVIIVGEDPASLFYVKMIGKTCEKVSINFKEHNLSKETSPEELLKLINNLNKDKKISGIIVQVPLPKHINQDQIQEVVNPSKDVDCFNPINMGRLALGKPEFLPCTPYAVYELIKRENIEVEGKHTVIIGRSNIVGRPMALILLQKKEHANATITVCHSLTKDLIYFTRQADILIAAVGKPEIIKRDMVKEGAIIIDVGTNEVGGKLVGDVAYDEVLGKVSLVTPVPGGVGPITNVMLMQNTLKAAEKLVN
ncbi:MAG: bifunctional 5,10-methylene-tetrahydrofolate dehydrogenase/5,10-methylene-tetrahydrofolate cyclohydrolase [Candidatus Infernicultor aquiphilus]|uniref:Bifunctional protein FolD n=1 Tax=Candidatus Infernicultor aquiphilus TaxID=1805029 RepID=A0A1J5G6E7_9BACT|nr:bifunctional 5,10-methylenetetrahydrofolate dehydrogenase/5,10-methenyltetrahydrofolate cyclohydrolase [bacterium]OIP68213.1 MAG: bifunctional 5,10-methylene-tetrahydrofolate dehydrogenase/5,10-methylene-tetrahydrofolate cyclohydrolase [Candidatus Atribacteria bacterium CG2_30_33_13]PIU25878.1 MAG: bifunctional 5,10-methylene-tetrahydrofolate dehydrogenase/5,10-methylene-tetrahydrofolate cyclohydrolase [Candidatus Atribacteria bacterium CG08_land_8_20_14_0_20_33_29]PIW12476.1 MAG: bifunctiona